jgi:hypothetical protein
MRHRFAAQRRSNLGRWTQVSITSDGSGQASGLQIFIDGKLSQVEVLKDNLSRDINPSKDNITLGARKRDRGFKNGRIDDVRIFEKCLSEFEVGALYDPAAAQAVWKKPTAELTLEEKQNLRGFFLGANTSTPLQNALAELKTARNALLTFLDSQPEIPVMRELPTAKKAFVLFRGQYDQRREEVFADTPSALPPFPKDAPRTRLGLAKWLTAPNHPLLARVSVNRLWQSLFGKGLVRTSEDFGSQEPRPNTKRF